MDHSTPTTGIRSILHSDRLYVALSLCFVVWMLWGIFPLFSYENDSMRIVNGVTLMHNTQTGPPPAISYQYNMQPLISYVLLGIKNWVPQWGTEQVYCALSALLSIVFFFLCVVFVRKVMGLNRLVVMLALVLLPESYAVMTYPNTAIFAAVPFLAGLTALWHERFWTGALFLCLAPLFRYDVLMVYPLVLGLFLFMGKGWKASIGRSALLAVVVVGVFALGCWLMHTNPFETVTDLERNGHDVRYSAVVKYVVPAFYTLVNIILLPLGVVRSVKRRKWALLLMSLLPILMLHVAYSQQGTAAKHFLYLLPFIITFTAPLIADILHCRYGRFCKWAFVVGIILYNLVSVRATIPIGDKPPLDTKQWMNEPDATSNMGPVATLFTENLTPLHLRFGIGAGQVVATADERLLFTGNFFYPFYIHGFKERWKGYIDANEAFFDGKDDCVICSGSVDALVAYTNRWLERGAEFSFQEMWDMGRPVAVYDFRVDGKRRLFVHKRSNDDIEVFRHLIRDAATVQNGDYYVVTLHDYECYCAEEFVKEGWLKRIKPCLYVLSDRE